MPDDPKIKGPQDRKRINIHEPYEVQYWTRVLGISRDQLRTAVEAVGTSAEKVKEYLQGKDTRAA